MPILRCPHKACLQQGFDAKLANGTECLFVPVLAEWIADLLETASLLNVRGFPSGFPDPNYIVNKKDLNSAERKFERQTEAHHKKARQCLAHKHFVVLPA